MRFATDIVAINLKEYGHSPQLLTDLGREGYELFDPTGYVFLRKHLALRSTPDVQLAPMQPAPPVAAPEPEDDQEYGPEYDSDDDVDQEGSDDAPEPGPEPTTAPEPAPAIVGDQGGSVYLGDVPLHAEGGVAGKSVSTFPDPNPGTATPHSQTGDGIDYDVLAARVCAELLKRQRRKPMPGLH